MITASLLTMMTSTAIAAPMSVIASDEHDGVLHLPAEAVIERSGIPGVFVLEEGDARFRMVRAAHGAHDTIAILSGLNGDEYILIDSEDSLYDGRPVADEHATR